MGTDEPPSDSRSERWAQLSETVMPETLALIREAARLFPPMPANDPPFISVADAIATALGYDPPTDGLLGSGLGRIMAYNRAAAIAKALGLAPTLDVEHVRRWGAGEVIHLGPESPRPVTDAR